MRKTYSIEVDCAACALKCEDAIKKMAEVEDCKINLMIQKMTIVAENPDALVKAITKTARKVEPDFSINE